MDGFPDLRVAMEELRVAQEELLAARTKTVAERNRYEDLFALAPDGYLVTDARAIITEANQATQLYRESQCRALLRDVELTAGDIGRSACNGHMVEVLDFERDHDPPASRLTSVKVVPPSPCSNSAESINRRMIVSPRPRPLRVDRRH